MPMRPCLLLTRPQRDSERFAQDMRAAGWQADILISPVLEIVLHPLAMQQLAAAKTLVVTSQHAVSALQGTIRQRDWPIWAVGPRTAEAAREAGFHSVMQSGGDASALLRDLLHHRPEEPILHLRGQHAAADIAQELRARGLRAESLVVYTQTSLPFSAVGCQRLQRDGDVVIAVFSPRSSRLLAEALRSCSQIRARLHLVAISNAAAEAFRGFSLARCCIAEHPDAPSMRRAILGIQAKLEP